MACGIIFYHTSAVLEDEQGCVLADGHNGPHLCRMNGRWYLWEPEFCGCEDCLHEDCSRMCCTLQETSRPTL